MTSLRPVSFSRRTLLHGVSSLSQEYFVIIERINALSYKTIQFLERFEVLTAVSFKIQILKDVQNQAVHLNEDKSTTAVRNVSNYQSTGRNIVEDERLQFNLL